MIKYIIKTILKNFRRNTLITSINILGLSLSFTVVFIILGHVQNQNKYDKNIPNGERVYRLETNWASMPTFIGDALTQGLNTYKNTRLFFQEELPIQYSSNEPVLIDNVVFADSTFFDILPVKVTEGSQSKLNIPFQIYLSKKEATRIFKDKNPIGELILVANQHQFQVAGVFDDLKYSHLKFTAVLSMVTLPKVFNDKKYLKRFDGWNCPTYILVPENTSKKNAEEAITECLFKYDYKYFIKEFKLRNYREIYFATNLSNEAGTIHGNKRANKILLIISIFIIILAVINYINLTTANAYTRYKWIGINRIVGATKKQIIKQFLLETIVICLISLWISILILEVINPSLNYIFSVNINLTELYSLKNIIWITAGIIVLGLISGLYPSFLLSQYLPIYLLKKNKYKENKGLKLRDILTVLQFTIAIVLIISTIIIYHQFKFISKSDLGFNSNGIVTVRTNKEVENELNVFKENLLKHPEIQNVTYTLRIPGNEWGSWCCTRIDEKEGKYFNLAADPDFFETYDIKLKEGRNFDWNNSADFNNTFILNEAAIKEYGIINPIGKYVDNTGNGFEGKIIGIAEDFHFRGFYHNIDPVIIYWDNRYLKYANILIDTEQVDKSIPIIKNTWEKLYPAFPFNYTFLDDRFDKQYSSDKVFGRLVGAFSIIACLIACIGILGFSFFYLNQQVKNIGIRKVHGASYILILKSLGLDFIKRILLAYIIAIPLSYYAISTWLKEFVYRIELSIWPFLIGGIVIITLAVFTVLMQTLKAARKNPVESLRYE